MVAIIVVGVVTTIEAAAAVGVTTIVAVEVATTIGVVAVVVTTIGVAAVVVNIGVTGRTHILGGKCAYLHSVTNTTTSSLSNSRHGSCKGNRVHVH